MVIGLARVRHLAMMLPVVAIAADAETSRLDAPLSTKTDARVNASLAAPRAISLGTAPASATIVVTSTETAVVVAATMTAITRLKATEVEEVVDAMIVAIAITMTTAAVAEEATRRRTLPEANTVTNTTRIDATVREVMPLKVALERPVTMAALAVHATTAGLATVALTAVTAVTSLLAAVTVNTARSARVTRAMPAPPLPRTKTTGRTSTRSMSCTTSSTRRRACKHTSASPSWFTSRMPIVPCALI